MKIKNHHKLFTLKSKLVHFGLDPRDWSLTEQCSDRWVIESTFQRDLRFVGQAEHTHSTWDWKKIELLFI